MAKSANMSYYYNHLPVYLLIISLVLTFIKADDLLEQYVKHVELVNNFEEYDTVSKRVPENRRLGKHSRNRRQVDSDIVWTHSLALDSDGFVVLKWQPRHQEILFRVEARTLGYVGLGFSPNGKMEGADMIIGWVDDDSHKAVLLDCHGVPKSQGSAPARDVIDNYTLMKGEQNDTHTILEFRRALDTCDPNDYVLSGDTVRMIWALHHKDPPSENAMIYHGELRGVQSVHLLAPPPTPKPSNELSRNWDVELKNFRIPNNVDTVYWCKVFKAPTLNTKHHITGFEPLIGKKHGNMVHHMIMHECDLPDNSNISLWEKYAAEEGQLCYDSMPPAWEKCLTPIVAWAIGSKGEDFPNHVGLPLGSRKNSYFMLEVHFDNPQMKTVMDTTGLRLQYTSKLRKNEGAILVTGVAPSNLHFIPPLQNEYKTAGYCSLGCTKEIFPKEGINVVSVMLHSHLAGRKLKLRHIRAGKELPPLAQDDHYDFNYQQSRALSQDTTILPGDGLITECTYSTKERKAPTLGGYSTREEMCLAFVLHYPRTELAGCYSIPPVRYFFETLGVKEFYGMNITQVEEALLEGKIETEHSPTVTKKPFEIKPGDEMSPEANQRAIMALKNAKEYSIEGATVEQSVFEKLIIKEPLEFQNKSFMLHLQNIPYNETILTKKIEEYFYNGLHMTFCRKRDDSLAIKETIENLPKFEDYRNKESIQCSYKSKRAFTSSTTKTASSLLSITFILNIFIMIR
ncbi:MOXD1 homolog 1 [Rhynchophorus ferrugineus]|uniref:MOXD1 homolog 1 n=1 Tax=Rhynchophorus ferrugineus TaxID=354439 RepID=UPI003FCC66F4